MRMHMACVVIAVTVTIVLLGSINSAASAPQQAQKLNIEIEPIGPQRAHATSNSSHEVNATGLALQSQKPVKSIDNIPELIVALDERRSSCTALAQRHLASERINEQKRRLDARLALQEIQNEASLYSMRNGRHNGAEYGLDLLDRQRKKEAEEERVASIASAERAEEVRTCVSDALAAGKDAFAQFKKVKRTVAINESASNLVASWIVNLGTISMQAPDGSDDSREVWQRDKARAELDSL